MGLVEVDEVDAHAVVLAGNQDVLKTEVTVVDGGVVHLANRLSEALKRPSFVPGFGMGTWPMRNFRGASSVAADMVDSFNGALFP